MKKHLLHFAFICFATLALAQTPEQVLRGTVTDADNASPLQGASLVLSNATKSFGANTTESGTYIFGKIPAGRYQLQVSHLGYEALVVAELLVESGRETVLNLQLREQADALQTIVVKATGSRSANTAGLHSLSIEEQFRFPGTNFDPARLAMSYPGVVGENDGTNLISVRGNSPNAFQWRLEGVEIVNPNHTANAGTFGDRPSGAGGGVNILSAQLLGTSTLYTGAFPAQYGNALGGIMDMYFRKGNDQRRELIAQAGFIGIEAAVEGPIGVGGRRQTADGQSRITNHESPSFLANYRYSFTGLLTAMGADFGDEETAYQDVAFHVSLPSAKMGQFSLFGVGGKSYTYYRPPTDSATIDKERFNIDFNSKMGALGLSHVLPLGKNSVLRTVAIGSALEHDRIADFAATGERWEEDSLRQQKLSFSSIFTHKISSRHRLRLGVEAARSNDIFQSFFKNDEVLFEDGGTAEGWLVQPFAEWKGRFWENLEVVAGLHASIFTMQSSEVLLEPRLNLNYGLGKSRFTLAYGRHSQRMPTYLMASKYAGKNTKAQTAHHLTLGYQLDIDKSLIFKAEAYGMALLDLPVFEVGLINNISMINFTDFSPTYLGNVAPGDKVRLVNYGLGLNYGLDLSLQKYITDDFFFLLAGSLYRSKFDDEVSWTKGTPSRPTRFDGRHALNLTGGREFVKQKNGKTIISGISSRVAWLGGFREPAIDTLASKEIGYTVYEKTVVSQFLQQISFSEKLDDYFRIDLRLYRKWNKVGKNSMLSLDIQNLTSRKNIQYHYFDTVQGKVLEKRQLGLIPILTWRGEF